MMGGQQGASGSQRMLMLYIFSLRSNTLAFRLLNLEVQALWVLREKEEKKEKKRSSQSSDIVVDVVW
jgi:hypothetical protein